MANPPIYNPNDYKVVEFHNSADFTFTPEMGCMFDGRPIFGITGAPGINTGESMTLPFHVGNILATNLAKAVMVRQAPVDTMATINQGGSLAKPLWSTERLDELKKSFLKELYTEARPIQETETDRLMRKVEELTQLVQTQMGLNKAQPGPVVAPVSPAPVEAVAPVTPATGPGQMAPDPTNTGPGQLAPASNASPYKDKQEVITELEVRGIKHDKRKSKDDLEKLLTTTPIAVPTAPEAAAV